MRRWIGYAAVAVVGAAIAVGGAAGAGDARPTDRHTEQISLWAVPNPETEVFLPADPDAEPPAEGEGPRPAVGDEFFFGDVLYALGGTPEAPAPVGGPIGVNNARCVVSQVFVEEEDAASTCSGVVQLDGRGDLTWQLQFRFTDFDDPGFVTAAITGGTGEFYDAGGEVVVRDAPGVDADDESAPGIYELHVLHLAQAGHSS